MPVTTAPSTEALSALVDQINAGTAYALDVDASYSRQEINPLEDIDTRLIDVVAVEETQLNETLAIEDRTSHKIVIWVREKLDDLEPETIDARCLLVRQIFQRVNNFTSGDGRVKVWEVDEETRMNPDKDMLNQSRLFVVAIILRVEVEAP